MCVHVHARAWRKGITCRAAASCAGTCCRHLPQRMDGMSARDPTAGYLYRGTTANTTAVLLYDPVLLQLKKVRQRMRGWGVRAW